jgi:hypothetical protein
MTTQDNPFAGAIPDSQAGSRRALWTGRVLSGLAVLFLVFDSVAKLLQMAPVIAATIQLGYPADAVFSLGLILLSCVVVYVIPRTSVLGAVLLTGYLGGAVATQMRVGNPLFSHTLFPIYIAAFIWGGLLLRDPGLRAFFPWRAPALSERSESKGATMRRES